MSFLKFWGKKDKHGDGSNHREDAPALDPEAEKRRLKHSLSISRSGRFKQKKRERGQILNQPSLFDIDIDGPPDTPTTAPSRDISKDELSQSTASNSSGSYVSPPPPPHKSSPRTGTHCRDVNHRSMAARNMRLGQSVVT